MNFEEVFRKMLIVINGIYDFRFDINFALLLQFLYIISPKKVSPKAVIDFFSRIFVYRSLYGQSFFIYISNMIDDFQDLLLHFSNLFLKTAWFQWWLYIIKRMEHYVYLMAESPYKVHIYRPFNWYYKKIIKCFEFFSHLLCKK